MSPRPPVSLWPDPDALGPLTDLYQLTMMAGYHAAGMAGKRATFELFVRKLPEGRAYLVFAGLEQAIGDLLRLAFDPEQIDEIRRWPAFRDVEPGVFDKLAATRFEGDVWAVPEGTVVFAGETLLRVEAPLPQAQWVETLLLDSLGYPTLVASKAARVVAAAARQAALRVRCPARPRAARRLARGAVGHDRRLRRARATSRPPGGWASRRSGTMAHSWVQSFATEAEAFAAFARVFPGNATLLVDTYDTLEGVRLRRGDRAAGPGDPDRQRRSRAPRPTRPARSSTSTAARA